MQPQKPLKEDLKHHLKGHLDGDLINCLMKQLNTFDYEAVFETCAVVTAELELD